MLFSEALDSKAKTKAKSKKDKQKEQADRLKKDESDKVKLLKDYPFIADEMLAMSGIMNDLSPEELDTELANFMKTGQSDKLTLEQVIELQRAKMRSEGRMGTPVTEESLAAWKKRKADKKMAEIKAKVCIILSHARSLSLSFLFAKKRCYLVHQKHSRDCRGLHALDTFYPTGGCGDEEEERRERPLGA